MCAHTPYRTLLTGIPVHIRAESFYDYLRAHVAECVLYNALLVYVPDVSEANTTGDENAGKERCRHDGDDGDRRHSPRPRKVATRRRETNAVGEPHRHHTRLPAIAPLPHVLPPRRSVGAAFVDFVNKTAAERTMRVEFHLAGALLSWQGIGSVVVHPGSLHAAYLPAALEERAHGCRAYDAARWRGGQRCRRRRDDDDAHKTRVTQTAPTSAAQEALPERPSATPRVCSLGGSRQGNNGVGAHPSLSDTDDAAAMGDEVWLRFCSDEDVTTSHSSPPARPVRVSDDDPAAACSSHGVRLFDELQRAIRGCTLGQVYSLVVLSANEVHLATDYYTAARLHELGRVVSTGGVHSVLDGPRGGRGKRRRSHVRESNALEKANRTWEDDDDDGDDDEDEAVRHHATWPRGAQGRTWTVLPHCRPRVDVDILPRALSALPDAADNNLSLATKNEVLEAMARMMSRTGGRCAGYRDDYGNIIFARV